MDKATYLKAVKQAKRIYGYIEIGSDDGRRQTMRLSKAKAAALVAQIEGQINAAWADDERTRLLVGGYRH